MVTFEVLEVLPFQELGPLLLNFLVGDTGDGLLDLLRQPQPVLLGRELQRVLHHEVPVRIHDQVYTS